MSEDFDDVLRRMRRELMGSMVAHMDDDALERWMAAWERADPQQEIRGLPLWFVKKRDEVRRTLLSVLASRGLQLWMRETLREMHKSPYLQPGQWEEMRETYRRCFPDAVEP